MKISPQGLALIKQEEQFRAHWYQCPAGKPTIGYGHVIQEGEGWMYNAAGLSEANASALLQRDVDANYGAHVAARLHRDVTQHQFDALTSFCFNVGTAGFDQSSVLALANAGSTNATAIRTAFGLWNKITNPTTRVKQVAPGLVARRAREAALYLS